MCECQRDEDCDKASACRRAATCDLNTHECSVGDALRGTPCTLDSETLAFATEQCQMHGGSLEGLQTGECTADGVCAPRMCASIVDHLECSGRRKDKKKKNNLNKILKDQFLASFHFV